MINHKNYCSPLIWFDWICCRNSANDVIVAQYNRYFISLWRYDGGQWGSNGDNGENVSGSSYTPRKSAECLAVEKTGPIFERAPQIEPKSTRHPQDGDDNSHGVGLMTPKRVASSTQENTFTRGLRERHVCILEHVSCTRLTYRLSILTVIKSIPNFFFF